MFIVIHAYHDATIPMILSRYSMMMRPRLCHDRFLEIRVELKKTIIMV
jgi:hypothetical protein